MEFEYHLTKFDMPEYATASCETLDIYADPVDAYKAMNQLEQMKKSQDYFYEIVLREKRK